MKPTKNYKVLIRDDMNMFVSLHEFETNEDAQQFMRWKLMRHNSYPLNQYCSDWKVIYVPPIL